jgi:hypothetical protein
MLTAATIPTMIRLTIVTIDIVRPAIAKPLPFLEAERFALLRPIADKTRPTTAAYAKNEQIKPASANGFFSSCTS